MNSRSSGNDAIVATGAYLSAPSFWAPDYIDRSAWLEHAPFAFWLVDALRPRMIVELGTHNGYSYFSFCQAVRRLQIDASTYAVDTWLGDEHSGFYGPEIFERVQARNETYYGAFSRLVRSTFDEASSQFGDRSIDLLHIDGRHFYGDVLHDFEAWRPKLSERAVVLFHDTNAREREFGVSRLWAELRTAYPSFEFHHGNGLGMLAYGDDSPDALVAFLSAVGEPKIGTTVREIYSRLGAHVKGDSDHGEIRLQLEARLGDVQSNVTALEAKLGHLGDVQANVTALEARLAHLGGVQANATALEAKLAHLGDVASKYDTEIGHLRRKLNESQIEQDRLRGTLAAVLSSRSWRISAPLRAAKRAAARIVRREVSSPTDCPSKKYRRNSLF